MLKRDISWTTINFLPTLTITDFTLDSDFLLNLAVERAGWRKWLRLVLLQFIFIVKPQRQECQHPIFCSSQCSFVTSNKIAKEYFISTLLEMYFCFCFLFPPFLPPSLPPPSLPSLLTSLFLFFFLFPPTPTLSPSFYLSFCWLTFIVFDWFSLITPLVQHVKMIRKDSSSALVAVYIQSHSLHWTTSSNTFKESV